MVRFSKLFTLSISSLLLISCTSATYRKGNEQIKSDNNLLGNLVEKSKNRSYRQSYNTVSIHKKGVFIGLKPFTISNGQSLPVNVEADGVSLNSSKNMSLQDIAKLIRTATSIPVILDDELKKGVQKESDGGSSLYDKLDKGMENSQQLQDYVNVVEKSEELPVNFKGKLSDFLNQVASYYDATWRYDSGMIIFSKYQVKTFIIATLPTKIQSSSKLNMGLSGTAPGGSGGGGGGDGLGVTHESSVKMDLKIWDDIKKSIGVIIGGEGKFNIAEGMSSVTVKTTPSNMLRVADYIENLNKQLRKQVTINVTVYSLKLDKNSEWNYSLSAVFSALKGHITGTLGMAGLSPSDGTSQAISGVTSNNSKFLLDLLDSQGKVSVTNSATVTTMSGQPVPLQVANARGYLSQITTTVSDNISSTSAQTGAINTGFSLDILPKVLNDGKVLVQYSVNISSLAGAQNGFDNVKVGENSIQLPNINQHAFIQESLMKNDETLVLAGYQNSDTESGDSGKGDPNFKALGGGRNAKINKQLIIICLTPTIINLDINNDTE
ncbi:hypothetical protein [Serratia sp. UGAL515B_01]|uniref:hypothetical protein n=1 Tax=Serratia sp. UGAL515B_01 TaxID=2986763 RepID=UPI002953FC38|nr:hypothetical protein [Serratia sp. UGAL515B_01]WON76958.1 hypothetical protein OK023_17585 [Serratia sp. UGAL515B_01]